MTADELIAELRDLADHRSVLLADRVAKLSPKQTAGALLAFVAIDAERRAADAIDAEHRELPPATPDAFAAVLDDVKLLGDALDGIDDFEGLVAGVFDALTPAEVRMVVFERSFRRLWERRARSAEQDGGGDA